jgi:hypothetical protein
VVLVQGPARLAQQLEVVREHFDLFVLGSCFFF